jgi:hypothetical protein
MKQIIVKSLAEPVGELWKTLQSEKTDKGLFIVSSPLSSTPLPIYEWVIDNADGRNVKEKYAVRIRTNR